MEINLPDVVDEVNQAFILYEKALIAGDLAIMRDFFWSSDKTLRYGISDQQFGIDEITQWRNSQGPLPQGRKLHGTIITTYGDRFATVNTHFTYPDSDSLGRQTQVWVRMDLNWRIVSAHVSQIRL